MQHAFRLNEGQINLVVTPNVNKLIYYITQNYYAYFEIICNEIHFMEENKGKYFRDQ